MTRPARFREADLTRAVRALEKAGVCVSRVPVLPDGGFELDTGETDTADNANWFAGSPLYKRDAA